MIHSLLVAASLAFMQAASQPATSLANKPGLTAEHLYNGINRPVMINAVSPRAFGKVTLVLMNAEGSVIGVPVDVYPGRIDLVEVMPDIWSLERAAFLQLVDLDKPVGAALVVQPMLSPLVPVTEQAFRPNGTPYSRIVRWID
jgi:hypothetical protein